MRPVDRVARLEADHAPPASLGEGSAGVGRVHRDLRERRLRPLEDRHAACEVERLLLVQPRHAGVVVLDRAEAALGLALLVVLVGLVDLEHGQRLAGLVGEHDLIPVRGAIDGEADRERPGQAARQPHLLDHALVVVLVHEALERRERAARDHVQVGELARGERRSARAARSRRAGARCGRSACRRAARSAASVSTTVTPSPRSGRARAPRASRRRARRSPPARAARCRSRAPDSTAPRRGRRRR